VKPGGRVEGWKIGSKDNKIRGTSLVDFLNRNKNINRGYRKLEVWNEAIELFVYVSEKLKAIQNRSFKVKAQVEDSAFSISSNIAEGYSRKTLKEYIQFINIAMASMSENYTQLFMLKQAGSIDEVWFKKYDDMHYSLENKLINLNRSLLSKLKVQDNWNKNYLIKEIAEKYEAD